MSVRSVVPLIRLKRDDLFVGPDSPRVLEPEELFKPVKPVKRKDVRGGRRKTVFHYACPANEVPCRVEEPPHNPDHDFNLS